jgi:Flp pilus assembly secretin CpaC
MGRKLSAKWAYGIVFATILTSVAPATWAQQSSAAAPQPITTLEEPRILTEPQPTQSIQLQTGMSTTIKIGRPFRTIHITNPDIIDALPISDQSAILVPKAVGATNIDIIDEHSARIASVNIFVGEVPGNLRVEVHNKKLVTSSTVYRCGNTGCVYVDEVQAKEPSPLPTGHSEQHYDQGAGQSGYSASPNASPAPR